MSKFKAGDYVIPDRDHADYTLVYKITDLSNSLGLDFTKVYKVTTYHGKNLEKNITYVDNHYRILTKAEEILYGKF